MQHQLNQKFSFFKNQKKKTFSNYMGNLCLSLLIVFPFVAIGGSFYLDNQNKKMVEKFEQDNQQAEKEDIEYINGAVRILSSPDFKKEYKEKRVISVGAYYIILEENKKITMTVQDILTHNPTRMSHFIEAIKKRKMRILEITEPINTESGKKQTQFLLERA